MKTSLFDYDLPEAAIAQHPLTDRDASRLLVLGPDGPRHATFRDWPELVPEGALVVLNDTRVINARILGTRRGSGGRVELLLTRRLAAASGDEEHWSALGRPGRSLKVGTVVECGPISAEIVSREGDSFGVRLVASGGVSLALTAHGHVPLPPYMRRPDEPDDVTRYQTVFARHEGSIAAPTAGLHLTSAALDRLAERGVEIGFVTLHVGVGTFRPVSADDLDDHVMHVEDRSVPESLVAAVARARERARPVVAVGTTVVRALESARDPGDSRRVRPVSGPTDLLIQPGYAFGPVDALLTNFHMPKSTLLALVAAFAGRSRVLGAYRSALDAGYRFLSYGDAMWIPERGS